MDFPAVAGKPGTLQRGAGFYRSLIPRRRDIRPYDFESLTRVAAVPLCTVAKDSDQCAKHVIFVAEKATPENHFKRLIAGKVEEIVYRVGFVAAICHVMSAGSVCGSTGRSR